MLGRRLPSSGKLGRSLQLINNCFFTLGGDPRNPPFPPGALRGLSEGSCRRDCPRKLEIMIYDTLYGTSSLRGQPLRQKPSESPRRTPEGKRRVQKQEFVRGSEHSEGLKKISFIINVLINLIKFHKNNIIRKRVLESMTLFIHSIIISYVTRKE